MGLYAREDEFDVTTTHCVLSLQVEEKLSYMEGNSEFLDKLSRAADKWWALEEKAPLGMEALGGGRSPWSAALLVRFAPWKSPVCCLVPRGWLKDALDMQTWTGL
jgi:hypothetical protein